MAKSPIYEERLTSRKTESLFLIISILFLILFIGRFGAAGFDWLAKLFLFFLLFFLFYYFNYRTLLIHITPQLLKLKFGVFVRNVAIENISKVYIDDLPPMVKYGGAGIHFMKVRNRYRIFLNFLEYQRVTVELKKPAGTVKDVCFSTRFPEDVKAFIEESINFREAGA